MKTLLVVDVLNGFCREKGPQGEPHALYCGPEGEAIVPRIAERIAEYDRLDEPVVFCCDAHAPNDPEFRLWPPHCIRGTEEARIVPELADRARRQIVVPKTTIDVFHRTELEDVLAGLGPDVVEVAGVCTNICVLTAVIGLAVRYYKVRVLSDCVASFDAGAHRHALEQMKAVFGAEVV